MASKATEEYRQSFITLLSKLSDIEQRGEAFFDKWEHSAWVPLDVATAQADLNQLLAELQSLESFAKESGLLSISGPPKDQPTQARSLAVRTQETLQAVDTFFQEKQRLLNNIRAAR